MNKSGPLNPDINPLYKSFETIPVQYWERLKSKYSEKIINFIFLSHPASLDLENKRINLELKINHTYQLYLVILFYLYQRKISSPSKDSNWVLPNELKGGVHFFRDSHPLNVDAVIKCFKNKKQIEKIINMLGGTLINVGDMGFILPVFEDVFLRYIFWEGDEEFNDSLTINVQKDLEDFFPLDVIWAMINIVNQVITYFYVASGEDI